MTLFERTLQAAVAERNRRASAKDLITRDELTAEVSPFGILRWYLHPELEAPSTRALYFCELEIPAGSRSGALFCQGGFVHFVLEGTGHTVVDGATHDWEPEDVIVIPIREDGVSFQHVNTGDEVVRMVIAWPNHDSAVGVEGGVAMAIRENSPEYASRQTSAATRPG
jgi:hypothetical protein